MAGAKDFARVVHAYYQGLREAGFTDEQAMTLTIGYQAALIAQLPPTTVTAMTGEPRRCTATTKNGQPCKGKPMRGRDVCRAHTGEPGYGRPTALTYPDVRRRLINALQAGPRSRTPASTPASTSPATTCGWSAARPTTTPASRRSTRTSSGTPRTRRMAAAWPCRCAQMARAEFANHGSAFLALAPNPPRSAPPHRGFRHGPGHDVPGRGRWQPSRLPSALTSPIPGRRSAP